VDLLRKRAGKALDEKSLHHLDAIATSALQMGQLVDDLLQFSRMARTEIRLSRVNLTELVAEVQERLQHDLHGRTVDWKVGPLPEVQGDPAMLRIVLTNLLSNAVKYTRLRHHARIEIGSQANGSEHIVFIRDNGVGFDMRYVGKLFGVFQRLHFEEEFEGTGIGLASVRRILLRHGGRVWAEGVEGEGATFYFALPKLAAMPPASAEPKPGQLSTLNPQLTTSSSA
jgi:light-regulated signal transduction histidine kinase (bacteriophytochrome)